VARPGKHWPMVKACRDEASLAVRLYNDPAEVRAFEGFVVHMHLAWLYLLHAEFTRDKVDYRYWRRDNPRLLEKVDGEPKRWELAKCVRERWPDDKDPVRANLEFFIGLRNKVEHRYAKQQQALAAVVGGQAQSLLLNYEEELVSEFGAASSLANTPPVSRLHRLVHQRGRQGSSSPPGHPAGDAADVHRGLQRRPRPHGERRPPVRAPPPRLSGARPEERPRRSVGPVQPLRRHDRRAAQGRRGGREEGPRGGQGAPAGCRRQGLEEAGGRSSPRSRRRSRSSSTRATSRRLGRS